MIRKRNSARNLGEEGGNSPEIPLNVVIVRQTKLVSAASLGSHSGDPQYWGRISAAPGSVLKNSCAGYGATRDVLALQAR
jgi:hypothetical protein